MTSSHLQHQSQYRSLESHHEQVCVAHLAPPGKTVIGRVEGFFEVN